MFSVSVSTNVYEPNEITASGENTKNGYRFTFGLDNYTDIVAVQMNVSWLPGMTTSNAQLIPTERLKNHAHLVTDLGNGTYQVLIYSMNNSPISANEGTLFTLDYVAAEGTEYKDTELQIKDIILSDTRGKNYASETNISIKATFTYILGDVNNDGLVNIADAIGLVNHILGKPTFEVNEMAADANEDGEINITDAIAIVNLILTQN